MPDSEQPNGDYEFVTIGIKSRRLRLVLLALLATVICCCCYCAFRVLHPPPHVEARSDSPDGQYYCVITRQDAGPLHPTRHRYVFAVYSHQTGKLLHDGKWEGVAQGSGSALTSIYRFDWSKSGLSIQQGFYGNKGRREYKPLLEAQFTGVKWRKLGLDLAHESQ